MRPRAASAARYPLIVVGSAPYAADYTERIAAIAAADPRIRLIGGVWDQKKLDQLYANALSYLHGHSVGGTNPSLLRAMGAGTAVLAWDVNFNRDVLVTDGRFFDSADSLAALIASAEEDPARQEQLGAALRVRAGSDYNWDVVTDGYEALAIRLAGGYSSRGTSPGRRAQRVTAGSASERVGTP